MPVNHNAIKLLQNINIKHIMEYNRNSIQFRINIDNTKQISGMY